MAIASDFILHAPPGEFNEVFNGKCGNSLYFLVSNWLTLDLLRHVKSVTELSLIYHDLFYSHFISDVRILLNDDDLLKEGASGYVNLMQIYLCFLR